MNSQDGDKKDFQILIVSAICFVILYFIQLENYLLFHIFAELFSIVIAFCVFIIVWNGKEYLKETYLLFLGLTYLFIGGLDILHTIGYNGMNIFRDYDFYANQFWIAARGLESVTLLFAIIIAGRNLKIRIYHVMIVYLVLSIGIIYSILFSDIFPVCFVEGYGQTRFKIYSEMVINLVLGTAVLVLMRKRRFFPEDMFRYIIISIIFTMISELAFTFYLSNYGFSNMLGHYAKIISFYYIYKAVVQKTIKEPYDSIFRELSEQKNRLNSINELKTRLFSIISHDLSGPVGSVASVVRSMDNDFATVSGETMKSELSEVRKSLDHVSDLLENLLAWSRLELSGHELRFSLSSPESLLKETLNELYPVFVAKDIKIETVFELTRKFEIDKDTFRIILRNIITNAIKFSGKRKTIKVYLKEENNTIVIRILDEGIGMRFKPEMLLTPVNISLRGTAGEKGAGLGLYMINKYTRENRGTLEISSNPGKGTEVSITFPCAAN